MLTAQSQAIFDRNGAVLRNARENRRDALRALREAGFTAMADELEAGS